MSLFRKILIGTGIVLVLLAVVGLFLPRQVHVARVMTVNATSESLFTILNGFTHFNKWSPWASLDPGAQYTYEGPTDGRGSRVRWVGDPATLGSGSMEVITSEPHGRVQVKLDFGPQGDAVITYSLTPHIQGTQVTMAFDGDMGFNPVSRYFGLMFDKMIGADFERGLAGLKAYAEGQRRP
ncbi:MAG: SRPBCC family protein [Vicinamibacterales bacterium]|nr:SRPBCC family protein [Vicinamibacterales bacterium]